MKKRMSETIKMRMYWWVLFVLLTVLFLSHQYVDILVTARQGINMWSIIMNGDFLEFYTVNHTGSGNDFYNVPIYPGYNILIYILFAVWNFPLAMMMKFTEIDVMNNYFCLLWIKLMLVVGWLLCFFVFKAIMEELAITEKMQSLAKYLYFSSLIFITVLFIVAQYDIFSLTIMLVGVLYYLRKDYKKFLIAFSFAVCFKYFALFLFVPLLLLKEKRLFYLLRDLLLVMVTYVVTLLPFIGHRPTEVSSFESGVFLAIFTKEISGEISLFVFAYGALLIYCYLTNPIEKAYFHHVTVWVSFVSFAVFFAFCWTSPYWKILLVPFALLLIANNPRNAQMNILLDVAAALCLVYRQYILDSGCFFIGMRSLLGDVLPPQNLGEFISITIRRTEALAPLFQTGFVVGLMALAYLNFPRKGQLRDKSSFHVSDDVLFLRALGITVVALLPIGSVFI